MAGVSLRSVWVRNRWWVQRLAMLPVHLFVFSIAVFFLIRLIPGDPVLTIAGSDDLSPGQYLKMQEALGLSGSLFSQLVAYLGNILTLDFGRSPIDGLGVLDQMSVRFPSTLEIALIAMFFAVLVTVALGIVGMLRPHNPISRFVAFYARAAGAIPDFVLGVAGILLFYTVLRWAPAPIGRYAPGLNPPPHTTGFPLLDSALSGDTILLSSMAEHLWLPILILVLGSAPAMLKIFQRSVARILADETTLFRIASGAPRHVVVASIVRRALPAMVTMCGLSFGFLLGGAVIIEQLFSIPGMGQYAIQAVGRSDFVALQGFLIIVASAVLVVFFLVDITNMLLDPRRRPGVVIEES
jgi:ABC-type dipeptide/oligopeptide/nickel transport system permease component